MKNFVIVGFLLACVAPSIASGARPIRGTYEVPVSQEDLKALSTYPIRFATDTDDVLTARTLNLQLPESLVGKTHEFELNRNDGGASGKWSYTGTAGEIATCEVVDRDFTCHLQFAKVDVSLEGARKILSEKVPPIDQSTMDRYLAVSTTFSHELRGIFRYRMRGRDRGR